MRRLERDLRQVLEGMRDRGLLVEEVVQGRWFATRAGHALELDELRRERLHQAAVRAWQHRRRSRP